MITVGNVYAQVDVSAERTMIAPIVRFRRKGYIFSDAFREGRWDGWNNLMTKDGRFPAGLVPHVLNRLALMDVAPEIQHTTTRPQPCDAIAPASLSAALMAHQEAAVEAAYQAGRGLIEHPVAAGKTLVLIELTRRCAVPTLILTHRKDLLYQLVEEFQKHLDIPGLIGIIGDGKWQPNWITISTFQSINAAMRNYSGDVGTLMKEVQAVMVDEVHHLVAATYEKVMKAAVNAFYRYGCSATVFKSRDDETVLKVQGWTGPVVSRYEPKDSIEFGRSVPADIFLVDYGAQDNGLPWPRQYEVGVVGHAARNSLIAQLVAGSPKPALVLVERIDQGKSLWALLTKAYYQKPAFISGVNTSKIRQNALEAFRQGRRNVLISSVILDEGIDLPNIKTLVLAGGGKAQHRIIQRIGRGQRNDRRKGHLIVFDFLDVGKYLGAHLRKRQQLYEREVAYSLHHITAEAVLDELRR